MAPGGQGRAQGLFILGFPLPEHPSAAARRDHLQRQAVEALGSSSGSTQGPTRLKPQRFLEGTLSQNGLSQNGLNQNVCCRPGRAFFFSFSTRLPRRVFVSSYTAYGSRSGRDRGGGRCRGKSQRASARTSCSFCCRPRGMFFFFFFFFFFFCRRRHVFFVLSLWGGARSFFVALPRAGVHSLTGFLSLRSAHKQQKPT